MANYFNAFLSICGLYFSFVLGQFKGKFTIFISLSVLQISFFCADVFFSVRMVNSVSVADKLAVQLKISIIHQLDEFAVCTVGAYPGSREVLPFRKMVRQSQLLWKVF